jgi:hypothetical protein
VAFENELRDFRADLSTLDAPAILNKYIYVERCAVMLDAQQTALRTRIAGKFTVRREDVIVVGSAKLGFSIAPGKRFRTFGDSSDIDVAIVSPTLYEQVWHELFDFQRSGTYWESERECEHYCFRGWIRPDKLHRSNVYPFSKQWWDFFQTLTASSQFGEYKITGALYHSRYFFEAYQRICLDQCKQQLEP